MPTLSPEVKCFAYDVLRTIGTPYAESVREDIAAGKWVAIAERKVSPRDYTSAQEYFLDASAASLLRKYRGLPTGLNLAANAVKDWLAGERDCYRTNERLSPYLEGLTHSECNEDVLRHVDAIRKKIASVLGHSPTYGDLEPRHGPRATYSDKSVRSTLADKMDNSASITSGALWYLFDWVGTAWGREALSSSRDPVFVRGNRFSTAPKDATKDRPIAAEPSINVFYQLGLGRAIRRRLKSRVGIDLDNGQGVHIRLAKQASIDGLDATLDLKNASGTVSYNLVKLLLPARWFRLLDELRSPFTRIDSHLMTGKDGEGVPVWRKLEQFSSMGNGFTFELETLLFWAIVSHTCEHEGSDRKVWVFGDDIICDSRCSRAVIAALRFFGFTLNEEKSFTSGPFRESCGGDFWSGRPVRPFFLKEPLDEPQQLIAAANGVRRLGKDLYGSAYPFNDVRIAILHSLPVGIRRCRGPEDLGDLVVHSDPEDYGWTSSLRDRVWCYRPVTHRKVSLKGFAPGTVLAVGLYGEIVSKGFINPRDSVTGYAVRKVSVHAAKWLPSPPPLRYYLIDDDRDRARRVYQERLANALPAICRRVPRARSNLVGTTTD